jgi:hypothetical protein
MKQGSTIFLRGVIFLMGAVVLGLCIFILSFVGQAGIYSPILIGLCVPAIPFFIGLYQTLKLLDYIDANTAFSQQSVEALKTIKRCTIAVGALFVAGMPFLINVAHQDDAPGVVAIGLIIIFAAVVVSVFAAVLQRLLEDAIAIKSENDLTV